MPEDGEPEDGEPRGGGEAKGAQPENEVPEDDEAQDDEAQPEDEVPEEDEPQDDEPQDDETQDEPPPDQVPTPQRSFDDIVPVQLTPDELTESQQYFDELPRKETPNRTAADAYEREHTGNYNYTLSGSGENIVADGYRVNDAGALEAKHVGNPARSPFIEDSSIHEPVRETIRAEQDDEFRRYGQVVDDPSNPVRHVEVITNDPRAVPYFERLMAKYDVPGQVIIKP